MRQRSIGRLHTTVSEIGLGCWQLGADWGDVDDATAMAVLHAAADAGVTFFDTADVYGDGRSEQFLGRFLTEREGLFAGDHHRLTSVGARRWPDLERNAPKNDDTVGSFRVKPLLVLGDLKRQMAAGTDDAILGAGDNKTDWFRHEEVAVDWMMKTSRG
jgi:aryl-alcohol dehydrogenase-like predicted oxidoreductase